MARPILIFFPAYEKFPTSFNKELKVSSKFTEEFIYKIIDERRESHKNSNQERKNDILYFLFFIF